MKNTVAEQSSSAMEAENIPWWAHLVQGIFSVIIGLLLLTHPAATTVSIIHFIGIYWLIAGVFSITGIFINHSRWGWKLLAGVIGIFAGLAVVQHPLWSSVLIPTVLVIMYGVNGIMLGIINFIGGFKGDGFSAIVLGSINFLFGLILLSSPLTAAFTLPWVFGAIALVGGSMAIFASFQQRKQEEAGAPSAGPVR